MNECKKGRNRGQDEDNMTSYFGDVLVLRDQREVSTKLLEI